MKIAVSGKGGVGKTTLTALLAQVYAERGLEVLAVDGDPSPCLAQALGFPIELQRKLQPIASMDWLVEERTGAAPGAAGGFFTLNPRVDDLPERFSAVHRQVRLLEMGTVSMGGSGCICPEAAMLKTLLSHLLFRPDEVLLLDMYAGVEHLGRATADFVDAMLIVAEPSRRSVATAERIRGLALDIGLERLWLVGNKVENDGDLDFFRREAVELPLLGSLPADPAALAADRAGAAVFDAAPRLRRAAEDLADTLEEQLR